MLDLSLPQGAGTAFHHVCASCHPQPPDPSLRAPLPAHVSHSRPGAPHPVVLWLIGCAGNAQATSRRESDLRNAHERGDCQDTSTVGRRCRFAQRRFRGWKWAGHRSLLKQVQSESLSRRGGGAERKQAKTPPKCWALSHLSPEIIGLQGRLPGAPPPFPTPGTLCLPTVGEVPRLGCCPAVPQFPPLHGAHTLRRAALRLALIPESLPAQPQGCGSPRGGSACAGGAACRS